MKKYLSLLFFLVLTLTFLSGCSSYDNSNSSEGEKNTDPGQSSEIVDWEPTTYETVNNLSGVTMTVKKETVSSTGLTAAFENNSDKQCIYGEYFLLENKINEKWYQVPVVIDGDYGFNDIGYELASGKESEWEVNWGWLYGSLDTGEYRIVKDILDFRDTGDFDTYYLAAEFTIR